MSTRLQVARRSLLALENKGEKYENAVKRVLQARFIHFYYFANETLMIHRKLVVFAMKADQYSNLMRANMTAQRHSAFSFLLSQTRS